MKRDRKKKPDRSDVFILNLLSAPAAFFNAVFCNTTDRLSQFITLI